MDQAGTYNEATVMWRLRHADGRSAHAVILPTGSRVFAFWFLLGEAQDSFSFNNWHDAIRWTTAARARLWLEGWRDWEHPKPTLNRPTQ